MRSLLFSLIMFSAAHLWGQSGESPVLDSLMQINLKKAPDSTIYHTYYAICTEWKGYNLDSAYFYSEEAQRVAKEMEDDLLIGKTLHQQSNILNLQAKYEEALEKSLQAEEYYTRINNVERQMSIRNNQGLIHWKMGNLDSALVLFKQYMEYADTSDFSNGSVRARNNAGLIYEDLGQRDLALKNYEEGIEIAKKAGEEHVLSYLLNNASIINRHQDRHQLALDQLQEALPLAAKRNNTDHVARINSNIGATLVDRGDISEGIKYLKKAYQANLQTKSSIGLTKVTWHIAEAYNYAKDYKRALHYADTTLYLSREMNAPVEVRFAFQILRDIHRDAGNEQQAITYYDSVYKWQKKIYDHNLAKQVATADKKYQNTILRHDLKEAKLKEQALKTKHRTLLWSVLAGLLALGSIVYHKIRANQKDKLLRLRGEHNIALLKAQEKEKERISRELHDHLGHKLLIVRNQMELTHTDQHLRDMIDETLTDLRGVSKNLHPYQLRHLGLVGAIEALADTIEDNSEIEISVDATPIAEQEVHDAQLLHLYRIIQELLTNVVKHAEATAALVSLHQNDQTINVLVQDNGKGIDTSKDMHRGLGWQTIKDRIGILGADLHLDSTIGKGTKVRINMPLQNIDNEQE